MVIYLDIVLLENIFMNYIILYATGIIYKSKIKPLRIIISSTIGGLYAIISYMEILQAYSNILLKVLLSVVMIYISFSPKNLKILLRQLVIFYLVSFSFGGVAFALLYFIRPQDILMKNGLYIGTYPIKVVILGAIVGFIVITTGFKVIKGKISKKDMFCEIILYINGKSKQVRAMIDTGNLLREPITRLPVIVVERSELYDILPEEILDDLENIVNGKSYITNEEYISKFRVIPYTSLGKQNGMLLGFKLDYILIKTEDENIEVKDIVLGIYGNSLTKNGLYTALIGLDILERSEVKNEYIATIKK